MLQLEEYQSQTPSAPSTNIEMLPPSRTKNPGKKGKKGKAGLTLSCSNLKGLFFS